MPQWSKLQAKLYDLISPDINLQLHCSVYRMNSSRGGTDLPRYWITLDKEIIWDYPKLVREYPQLGEAPPEWYPYNTDIDAISDLFREYIDTPVELLFEKHFENDHWELTNILKAADRRIGQRRLRLLKKRIKNQAAHKVLMKRIEVLSTDQPPI